MNNLRLQSPKNNTVSISNLGEQTKNQKQIQSQDDEEDDKTQQLEPRQQKDLQFDEQIQYESQSQPQSSQTQQNQQEQSNSVKNGTNSKQNYNYKRQKSRKQIINQLFASKPKIPGARRFIKNGQVYYRTKTKHFQPQKHYIHQKQSNIMKSWVYGNGKTNDRVFISSWNINGIRNALHKPQVKNYIKQTNPDILCITQHKINQWNYKRKPVIITGYNGYWNFCKCSAGYSGIVVFSKFMPISAYQDFQQKQLSQEGRVLTLQFQKFYLVTAYIPAAGHNLQRLHFKVKQYEVVFRRHIQKLLRKKYVIITGDLNVCHTNMDYHIPKYVSPESKQQSYTPTERKSFQKLLNMGFTDTFRKLNPNVRKYSWWNVQRLGRQKNLGKRLDYFLIDNRIVQIAVRSQIRSQIEGSDHCPIQLNIDWKKFVQKKIFDGQKLRNKSKQIVKNQIQQSLKQKNESKSEEKSNKPIKSNIKASLQNQYIEKKILKFEQKKFHKQNNLSITEVKQDKITI